jgi:hypothetical protein
MSHPNRPRFQKVVVTGWIATSKSGAVSQAEGAVREHPELPEGFPTVWKFAKSCPARTIPLKVRVTVERVIE